MNTSATRRDDRNQISRLYDDPFQSLENRMSQFFRGILDSPTMEAGFANYPVDVNEDDEKIVIEAELPGFKTDEVEVNLENGVLTIKAERSSKSESENVKTHLNERRFTRVKRAFTLPRTVDGSDVEANLSEGILTLTLNKTEESKPRKIEIKG